jgi:hypothetical protein
VRKKFILNFYIKVFYAEAPYSNKGGELENIKSVNRNSKKIKRECKKIKRK